MAGKSPSIDFFEAREAVEVIEASDVIMYFEVIEAIALHISFKRN